MLPNTLLRNYGVCSSVSIGNKYLNILAQGYATNVRYSNRTACGRTDCLCALHSTPIVCMHVYVTLQYIARVHGPHLNNSSDVRIVHPASRHVRRKHDPCGAVAELLRHFGTVALGVVVKGVGSNRGVVERGGGQGVQWPREWLYKVWGQNGGGGGVR